MAKHWLWFGWIPLCLNKNFVLITQRAWKQCQIFNKHALFLEKLLYLRHDQSQQDTINTVFLPRRHENTNNNRKGTFSKQRCYSQNIVLCNVKKYDWGWAGQILKLRSSTVPDQCWVIH